jgi:hypothetical protein
MTNLIFNDFSFHNLNFQPIKIETLSQAIESQQQSPTDVKLNFPIQQRNSTQLHSSSMMPSKQVEWSEANCLNKKKITQLFPIPRQQRLLPSSHRV